MAIPGARQSIPPITDSVSKEDDATNRNDDFIVFRWRLFAVASYFMRFLDIREKAEWDEFMDAQAEEQLKQIVAAKPSNSEFVVEDGAVEAAWKRAGNMRI